MKIKTSETGNKKIKGYLFLEIVFIVLVVSVLFTTLFSFYEQMTTVKEKLLTAIEQIIKTSSELPLF